MHFFLQATSAFIEEKELKRRDIGDDMQKIVPGWIQTSVLCTGSKLQ